MCYAIPGKVVEIGKRGLVVDYFGEQRSVINEFNEPVSVGDYVYAQSGIVVKKISEKEALLILEDWKELFFKLKEQDLLLAKTKELPIKADVRAILEKRGALLEREELLYLLKIKDKEELKALFQAANALRQEQLQNSCCVHGILEFSNYCRNMCTYCGIRATNKKLERYRLMPDEIVQLAEEAVNKHGFKALVLQSGEDLWYSDEKLLEIVKRIRKRCGALLFLSIGTRSLECYTALYEAGARGVLIRFETSNPRLYARFHSGPKADLKYRLELLKHAKQLGYIIITGSLIGLPGQTEEDLVNDILLAKFLGAEMYSFGPLIATTKRSDASRGDIATVLKVLAVSRLADPNARILVTTALETLDEEGRRLGLLAGANSLMLNVTPPACRKRYAIYPNRAGNEISVEQNIQKTRELLFALGRAPTDLGR